MRVCQYFIFLFLDKNTRNKEKKKTYKSNHHIITHSLQIQITTTPDTSE
jgi:hypothetical protein